MARQQRQDQPQQYREYMEAKVPPELGADATCVILVGGTFDPVHRAHVEIPSAVRATLKEPEWRASWLIFVPAAVSPFKVDVEAALGKIYEATPSERVSLLRIAIQDTPRACVWTDEIDRMTRGSHGKPEPSYTVDTLRRMKAMRPEISLKLLIGADQARQLFRWRECHEVIRLAPPLSVPRSPIETAASLRAGIRSSGVWSSEELQILEAGVIESVLMPQNSSEIRAKLAAGTSAGDIADLDPQVAKEIERRGLYRRVE